jgi:hypothetical protein
VAKYGPAQVAGFALKAGFRGQQAAIAVAVSNAENGSGDSNAINRNSNGSVDVGLWQINSSNADPGAMKDPQANANEAFRLANNGRGWDNWTQFRNKKYLIFMIPAAAAVLAAQAANPKLGLQVATSTPIPGPTVDIPGGGVEGAIKSLTGPVTAVGDAIKFLTVGENWARIAIIAFGGLLLVTALVVISRPVLEPVAKVASKGLA